MLQNLTFMKYDYLSYFEIYRKNIKSLNQKHSNKNSDSSYILAKGSNQLVVLKNFKNEPLCFKESKRLKYSAKLDFFERLNNWIFRKTKLV